MKNISRLSNKAEEGKKIPDFLRQESESPNDQASQLEALNKTEKQDKQDTQEKEQEDEKEDAPQVPTQKTYIDKRKEEQESSKSQSKQESEAMEKVNAIIAHQELELYRAKSLFPFTFFPDTIIIDTNKVTVIKKQFFANEFITTIPLKDLSDVTVQTSFFMGSIQVEYMPQASSPGAMTAVHCQLTSLRRSDAINIQNILKGALIAKAEDIDIAKLPPDEVKAIIEKFGSSEGVE